METVEVSVDRQKLLLLIELHQEKQARRIFHAIDNLLLQRGVDLGPGDRRGIGPKTFHHGHVRRVLHSTDLETGKIAGRFYDLLAIKNAAEATLGMAEEPDAGGLQEGVVVFLPKPAIHHLPNHGRGAEQEGHAKHETRLEEGSAFTISWGEDDG